MKTIIVGGVAGGASAAVRLRRLCEKDEIVLFEKGDYISYANCGLPYYISGVIDKKRALTLQTPKQLMDRFAVDVRVGSEVLSIDTEKKCVAVRELATGREYTESYDKMILAPGAVPLVPGFVENKADRRIFVLKDIPDTLRIKDFVTKNEVKNAVVIGGGFIGLETAENLAEAGVSTKIVELSDHVLQQVDWDMAQLIEQELRNGGVDVHCSEKVEAVKSGQDKLMVNTDKGSYEADMVVMSLGVRPATGFAEGAVELNAKGAIVVGDDMRTSNPDIYAAGDAVCVTNAVDGEADYLPLAGPANKQGRIAADNIAGIPSKYTGSQGSSILKVFGKTAARTGLSESRAKNYEKSYTFSKSHAGYYPGATDMWIKVIFDKDTGKLLGAQAFGEDGVDKRMDVFATAIRLGLSLSQITELELCYAPPYGSAKDPVNMAAYAAENVYKGLVKIFHGDRVAELQERGAYILDVRTAAENRMGRIEGSVNIPLDDLRGRLSELPKDQPIYVHCAIGLRGYLACRILSQNGFDCLNLSGGYSLYHQLYGKKQGE